MESLKGDFKFLKKEERKKNAKGLKSTFCEVWGKRLDVQIRGGLRINRRYGQFTQKGFIGYT